MLSSRHLKCGAVFVSESPASEPVDPDISVQDLVHDDIQDMVEENANEDKCATCKEHQKFHVDLVTLVMH